MFILFLCKRNINSFAVVLQRKAWGYQDWQSCGSLLEDCQCFFCTAEKSSKHSKMLKFGLLPRKLVTDSETRWGSWQKMIQGILEQEKAITQGLAADRSTRNLVNTGLLHEHQIWWTRGSGTDQHGNNSWSTLPLSVWVKKRSRSSESTQRCGILFCHAKCCWLCYPCNYPIINKRSSECI